MKEMSERERFYRREAMFEGGTAGRWIRLGRADLAGISAAKAYTFARIALRWAKYNGSLSAPTPNREAGTTPGQKRDA